jgi:hypothetical protein
MPDSASTARPATTGRIDAGPVLAETARNLVTHMRVLPRLAWPALLVALAVPLVQRFALGGAEGAGAFALASLPFDLMLGTAWLQLILRGPGAARVPALGWGRAETDFTIWAFVFAVAVFGTVVLVVLVASNLPLDVTAGRILIALTAWFALSLMTPLAIRVPVRVLRAEVPGRAWQARAANVPNAALCWLVYLALAVALSQLPAALPDPTAPATATPLALLTLVVQVAVDYTILLTVLALIAAMARQLAGWPTPGDDTQVPA